MDLAQPLQEEVTVTSAKLIGVDQIEGIVLPTTPCRPPLPIGDEARTTAGDQRMNMSVGFKLLIPRVQHHRRSHLVVLLFFDARFERSPGGGEQKVVDLTAVAEGERRKILWQGENDLKIGDAIDQQGLGLLNPLGAFTATAAGTVTIATRVVDLALAVTARASVPTRTERVGAAQRKLGQRALNLRASLAREPADEVRRVSLQDSSDAGPS